MFSADTLIGEKHNRLKDLRAAMYSYVQTSNIFRNAWVGCSSHPGGTGFFGPPTHL
jgi:hypothetical protein